MDQGGYLPEEENNPRAALRGELSKRIRVGDNQ
jgi:hypothetical protein